MIRMCIGHDSAINNKRPSPMHGYLTVIQEIKIPYIGYCTIIDMNCITFRICAMDGEVFIYIYITTGILRAGRPPYCC